MPVLFIINLKIYIFIYSQLTFLVCKLGFLIG